MPSGAQAQPVRVLISPKPTPAHTSPPGQGHPHPPPACSGHSSRLPPHLLPFSPEIIRPDAKSATSVLRRSPTSPGQATAITHQLILWPPPPSAPNMGAGRNVREGSSDEQRPRSLLACKVSVQGVHTFPAAAPTHGSPHVPCPPYTDTRPSLSLPLAINPANPTSFRSGITSSRKPALNPRPGSTFTGNKWHPPNPDSHHFPP